jgi:hypothetical protein
MSVGTFIGFMAACFTTACFVPQVVKTWRTRSTGDISLGTFGALTRLGRPCGSFTRSFGLICLKRRYSRIPFLAPRAGRLGS